MKQTFHVMVIYTQIRLTFQFVVICFAEFRYPFVFYRYVWKTQLFFSGQKPLNTAVVTEQTTEAFDLKLIGFIQRGRIHWNFSHSISMV